MRLIIYFCAGFGASVMMIAGILVYMTFLKNPPFFQFSEIWLENIYKAKNMINSRPSHKQRLLIVSGSNSLFGFNSSIIDLESRFQPINYATHAGLPINYHIDMIIENAKAGDIVFMPLEFDYYTRKKPLEDLWYIQNMLTWGKDYNKYINIPQKIMAYLKNAPLPMTKAFIKDLILRKDTRIFNFDKIINNTTFNGYNYTSLNLYGDFASKRVVKLPSIRAIWNPISSFRHFLSQNTNV